MTHVWHWISDRATDVPSLVFSVLALLALIFRTVYKFFEMKKIRLEIRKLTEEVDKLRRESEALEEKERRSGITPPTLADVEKYDPKVKEIERQQHYLRQELSSKEAVLARYAEPLMHSAFHYLLSDLTVDLLVALVILRELLSFLR